MNALPITHLTVLAAGLIGASATDLARRRVPNAISAFVFVTGLAVRGYDLGAGGALGGLAASTILLFALYGLWRARAVGGGDVKLAAAVGAWIGLSRLPWFVLASAVAGGIVAVAISTAETTVPPTTKTAARSAQRSEPRKLR